MPDYRITQGKLLRLATLAAGVEPPKFDEVMGILREATPILDGADLTAKRLDDATDQLVRTNGGVMQTAQTVRVGRPFGGDQPPAPLPPVTGIDSVGAADGADADTAPAKPE